MLGPIYCPIVTSYDKQYRNPEKIPQDYRFKVAEPAKSETRLSVVSVAHRAYIPFHDCIASSVQVTPIHRRDHSKTWKKRVCYCVRRFFFIVNT